MPFIVFEGLDGAGKSTLISGIADELRERGKPCIHTREPGGTPLGEEVREILLRTKGDPPAPIAELFLYEAARHQHIQRIIQPALKGGKWVLCDRFTASTIAFQVGGRGLNLETVEKLNRLATENLEPDLVVLVDLPEDEAQKRIAGRTRDRFESEKEDFHRRVRQSYLDQAASKSNWLVLDGSKAPGELKAAVLSYFTAREWL